jgi:hypothetical protein
MCLIVLAPCLRSTCNGIFELLHLHKLLAELSICASNLLAKQMIVRHDITVGMVNQGPDGVQDVLLGVEDRMFNVRQVRLIVFLEKSLSKCVDASVLRGKRKVMSSLCVVARVVYCQRAEALAYGP